MRCSVCQRRDLVTIHLTISSEPVALYRCPRCDIRVWEGPEGEEWTRDRVLELVRAGH